MAVTIPLLIGLDDLKFYLGITENFDSRLLEPLVIQSTDLAAQNVLGTSLMIKLRNDYNSNTLSRLCTKSYMIATRLQL